MIYCLKVEDNCREYIYFVDPKERFSEGYYVNYGPPIERRIFGVLLEEMIQEQECEISFPYRQKWLFVRGNSEEEIRNGKFELVKELELNDKDPQSLFDFYTYVNESHPCIIFRIKLDY